ncbi:MAG TPA: hypothetical protein VFG83_02335 [Kofleriaceae bacterium]|nr:hypothetical protein [Kofleriaceae bacterium]
MTSATGSRRDIHNPYFEYTNRGSDVVEDGLKALPFGEFLVEQNAIDRFQLFCALQLQDRRPGSLIGECVTQLGFLDEDAVERLLTRWQACRTVEL